MEVARLIETLALGSVSESTKQQILSKWKTWAKERARSNLGPWLLEADGVDIAVTALTRFMASRCFVHNNQSGTDGSGVFSGDKNFSQNVRWMGTPHFALHDSRGRQGNR